MLIPVIPESGRECIPKKEENLKTGVHWNHTTLGLYTLGCFGTYSSILLSQSNSNSLARAKYLKKHLYVQTEKCSQTICWEDGRLNLKPSNIWNGQLGQMQPPSTPTFQCFLQENTFISQLNLVPRCLEYVKNDMWIRELGNLPVLSVTVTTEFWNEKAKDAVHVIFSLQKGKPITSLYRKHN